MTVRNSSIMKAGIVPGFDDSTVRPNGYRPFARRPSRPRISSNSPTDRQSVQVDKFVGKGFGKNEIMFFVSAIYKPISVLDRASATMRPSRPTRRTRSWRRRSRTWSKTRPRFKLIGRGSGGGGGATMGPTKGRMRSAVRSTRSVVWRRFVASANSSKIRRCIRKRGKRV